jgi:hypothetical protein
MRCLARNAAPVISAPQPARCESKSWSRGTQKIPTTKERSALQQVTQAYSISLSLRARTLPFLALFNAPGLSRGCLSHFRRLVIHKTSVCAVLHTFEFPSSSLGLTSLPRYIARLLVYAIAACSDLKQANLFLYTEPLVLNVEGAQALSSYAHCSYHF